MFELIIVVGPL